MAFFPPWRPQQLALTKERLFAGSRVVPGYLSGWDKHLLTPRTVPLSSEAGGIVSRFSGASQILKSSLQ